MMLHGSVKHHLKLAIPVYVLLLVILVLTSIFSPSFRTIGNFNNVVSQMTPIAIVALGQTVVLLLAGIDLSVGSIVSLATVIMAIISGRSELGLAEGIILSLLTGLIIGWINGVGITKLNIPPLIMTLSTMAIVQGIALYLLPAPGGDVSEGFMELMTYVSGPFSTMGILVLLLYILFFVILASTRFGRFVYATGGEENLARKSGVPHHKIQIYGYMLSGAMAALGGIVLSARIFSGDPVIGTSYSMDSITAAIVGGTSLFGGIGGVVGTFAGVILLALTNNVLNMLGVFAYYQYIIKAIILVLSIFLFQMKWGRKK